MKKTLEFGVSGDVGSFSEIAGLRYAEQANISPSFVYLIDMDGVLKAVEAGTIDIGIFPVVNFHCGLVNMALEAMGKHFFTPIDQVRLTVHQCLLVQTGTMHNQIKQIVSHPQGLGQCEQYLKKVFKGIEQVAWQDTAKAARELAQGTLPAFSAVIAPERCAEIYGLEVLARNIQDDDQNTTIFTVIKK